MIQIPAILKLLTPKVLNAIISYVFDKNDLDYKVEELEKDIKDLKNDAHPPIFSQAELDDILKRLGRLEDKYAKSN